MLTFRFALLSSMLGSQCPHCHAKLEPMSGPARAGGRIFGDGTVGVSSQGEMMGANMRVSMGMPQVHSGNFGNLRGGDMGAGMGSSSRPQYLGGGVSMHMGGRDYNQYPGDEYPGDGTFFPTSQMPNFPNASMRNSPGDGGQQKKKNQKKTKKTPATIKTPALISASENCHGEVVEKLLEKGASVDVQDMVRGRNEGMWEGRRGGAGRGGRAEGVCV